MAKTEKTAQKESADMLRTIAEMPPLRRCLLIFAAGLVTALAMPPAGLFFVLWGTLPFFYLTLADAANRKQAFWSGWLFGAGFFLGGLFWVTHALFVDLAAWWWIIPFALLGIPAVLSIYTGILGLAVFQVLKYSTRIGGVFAFAALWCVMEYLRGILFTGFPWNLSGYVWTHSLAMLQNLSWAGVYGLGALTVTSAMMTVFAFLKIGQGCARAALAVSVILPLALWGWGALRLALAGETVFHDAVTLRVVQPNIPQHEKWMAETQAENFQKLLTLSNADKPADIIIWPETALTADIDAFPTVGTALRNNLPADAVLMTGNIFSRADEQGKDNYYNSLMVLNIRTGEKAQYPKSHLVPFGEYVPFRSIFSVAALGALLSGFEDFQAGDGPYTATDFGLPAFSPLICYEVIFPGRVTSAQKERPAWLLNVTNDGWYGNSPGPYQHFAFSRARAIEEGLPLIRAANTGISAVIDSYGRIMEAVSLGETGVITLALPRDIPPTFYARYHRIFFAFAVFFLILPALILRKRM
ncbi:MAG: apolipoprotein N-acyltransferase [Alphaproteobacteria bacterium]|nr:MAG: apolipoprotein N-acyltransferase [Alphaproteobacteria bacterium]